MNRRNFIPRLGFLLPLLALPQRAKAQPFLPPAQSSERIYRARLSQSGNNAPTADVMVNTLGCDVNWIHWDLGTYIGSFGTPFDPSAKVFCYAPVRDNAGDVTTGTAHALTMDGNYGSVMICAYGNPEDHSIQRAEIEGDLFVSFEVFVS